MPQNITGRSNILLVGGTTTAGAGLAITQTTSNQTGNTIKIDMDNNTTEAATLTGTEKFLIEDSSNNVKYVTASTITNDYATLTTQQTLTNKILSSNSSYQGNKIINTYIDTDILEGN